MLPQYFPVISGWSNSGPKEGKVEISTYVTIWGTPYVARITKERISRTACLEERGEGVQIATLSHPSPPPDPITNATSSLNHEPYTRTQVDRKDTMHRRKFSSSLMNRHSHPHLPSPNK